MMRTSAAVITAIKSLMVNRVGYREHTPGRCSAGGAGVCLLLLPSGGGGDARVEVSIVGGVGQTVRRARGVP